MEDAERRVGLGPVGEASWGWDKCSPKFLRGKDCAKLTETPGPTALAFLRLKGKRPPSVKGSQNQRGTEASRKGPQKKHIPRAWQRAGHAASALGAQPV